MVQSVALYLLGILLSGDPSVVQIEPDVDPAPGRTTEDARREEIPPSDRVDQDLVLARLRSQSTIRTARAYLERQEYAEAIEHLEASLDAASGSHEFLAILEESYRKRIAELIGRGASKEASILAARLRVLAGASLDDEKSEPKEAEPLPRSPVATAWDNAVRPISKAVEPVKAAVSPIASAMATPASKLSKAFTESVNKLIPRAISGEDRSNTVIPKDETVGEPLVESSAPSCPEVDRALKLFAEKRYPESLIAFQNAHQQNPAALQPHSARWGYSLLYVTVARYNELIEQDPVLVDPAVWEELSRDARSAAQLAPAIEYASKVIASIESRQQESLAYASRSMATPGAAPVSNTQAYARESAPPAPTIQVRHHEDSSSPWKTAESKNFIIRHRDPQLAEEVARIAERARIYATELWFQGEPISDWIPKCEITVYPTAQEYGVSTGVGPQSPGHSQVVNQGGQILSRKLMIRADDPNMKLAVLPHEVTHVVLAGRFGSHIVPRWADEGMAVLTEPLDKQDAHLANLSRTYLSGQSFTCMQVMTMQQYPAGERMRDFYAHSVGVCRFLIEKYGHDRLVAFLRQSLETNNYERALQDVLGMSDFDQLEADFRGYVVSLNSPAREAAFVR